jgi:hypothetical protein
MVIVVDPAARTATNGAGKKPCGEGGASSIPFVMPSRWAGGHLFAYRIIDMRWMYDKRQCVAGPGSVNAGAKRGGMHKSVGNSAVSSGRVTSWQRASAPIGGRGGRFFGRQGGGSPRVSAGAVVRRGVPASTTAQFSASRAIASKEKPASERSAATLRHDFV